MCHQDAGVERVFVDEAGAPRLPHSHSDADEFYVICAILVAPDELQTAEQSAQELVQAHAGSGELKSSSIGNNTARRRRIAEDIAKRRFGVYCLVVNKALVWTDSGLRWPRTFYKFLHNMVYTRIRRHFVGISVLADIFGRTDFMDGFRMYIESKGWLFDSFDFAPSSDVPLLQVADVIAGTVRRVYLQDDPSDLLDAFGSPGPAIEVWPPCKKSLPSTANNQPSDFDTLVRTLSVEAARDFVESSVSSTDEDARLQVEAVRYLLYRYNANPLDYVYRSVIVDELRLQTGIELSDQMLSSRILAPARDAGVLLCSTDKGVKIPFCAQDIEDWMARVDSQIVPYLKRLDKARNDILIATHNKYDIVNSARFPELARYLKGM